MWQQPNVLKREGDNIDILRGEEGPGETTLGYHFSYMHKINSSFWFIRTSLSW